MHTCVWVGAHINAYRQRPEEDIRCLCISLSTCSFEAGALSLNLWFVFSQLGWEPGSPSDPPVSDPLRAGSRVYTESPSYHVNAGI